MQNYEIKCTPQKHFFNHNTPARQWLAPQGRRPQFAKSRKSRKFIPPAAVRLRVAYNLWSSESRAQSYACMRYAEMKECRRSQDL